MANSNNVTGSMGCLDWAGLSADDHRLIETSMVRRDHLPGEAIFHEGDDAHGVYIVEKGLVGLRKLDCEGNSLLLHFAHEGQPVGYRAVIDGGPQATTAECLEPTTVYFIRRSTFLGVLARNPTVAMQFLHFALHDLGVADLMAFQAHKSTVRARFASLLWSLKDRYATSMKDGTLRLDLPFTKQSMAEMIGIRPETMSRLVRQFHDEGIADFKDGSVHVRDADELFDAFEPALAA